MHSALARPATPLLASLGLHGCLAFTLWIAVRHALPTPPPELDRADSWLGNAVEVDAVTTPDGALTPPSSALAPSGSEATRPAEPAPRLFAKSELAPTHQPDSVAPRPRPVHAAKTARSALKAASPTANASANVSASSAAPATGAFGAEGLPPGVRSLPSAFTRAIPPATGADPLWQSLPIGTQRAFTIAIEVDAEGHIQSSEIVREKDGTPPAPQFAHVRERVVALLGAGLFALQNNVAAGRELFRITITLSDRPVHEDDDPAQLVERGFDPPRATMPGRAYFTLASGRHFDAKVQVLPRP